MDIFESCYPHRFEQLKKDRIDRPFLAYLCGF